MANKHKPINHECYCKDENYIGWNQCEVCYKEFNDKIHEFERVYRCSGNIVAICGFYPYICKSCKDEGYYSMKGTGGGNGIKNNIDNSKLKSIPALRGSRVQKYWDIKNNTSVDITDEKF